ncbi:hypothetical protein EUTSA_v10009591mg [Eutrema salsugineum]|uniref:F-box associated domain-containing protein n=1 Tax=Eutrema salsugineum TaxID=72664 RepID=V4MRH8_EUTSA|nr:hypothetical protein EUTSA_v10009591mg [Eutrema salsugineum]
MMHDISVHKFNGTYKPIWLYNNSDGLSLNNNATTTTCEVFDFTTNAWRYIVNSKAPFLHGSSDQDIIMCNLDDRLCVSEKIWSNQLIWSFDSDHKTWKKTYSIDLDITSSWVGNPSLHSRHLQFWTRIRYSYTSELSPFAICYFLSLISVR